MVNSGLPLMKPLVPSSGSTRKNAPAMSGMRPAATSSSAMTGTPGARRASPARMISSDCRSAAVTGLWSALRSTATPGAEVRHLHAGRGQGHAQEAFGEARISLACIIPALVIRACAPRSAALRDVARLRSRRVVTQKQYFPAADAQRSESALEPRREACIKAEPLRKRFCWPAWRALVLSGRPRPRSQQEQRSSDDRARPADRS